MDLKLFNYQGVKLQHYGEVISLRRTNCFLAAAMCNSITKRGWFTAASEDRRVVDTGKEYKFGHQKAEAVGRVAQSDPWLLQYSVKEGDGGSLVSPPGSGRLSPARTWVRLGCPRQFLFNLILH